MRKLSLSILVLTILIQYGFAQNLTSPNFAEENYTENSVWRGIESIEGIIAERDARLENTKSNFKGKANETDSLALVALYNDTDGENWENNSNWLTGNLSTWYGITLNGEGRVTVVELSFNELSGEFSQEIGNMLALTELSMQGNHFTTPIPPEIGNLENLSILHLYNSELTGGLPEEIGNLTNLTDIYMTSNNLTEPIPASIGNLTNLIRLDLSYNFITGSIPVSIGNMSSLIDLALYYNHLSGEIPAEMGNLANIDFISLSGNDLTGEIPLELANMSSTLTHITLSNNQLTGTIPAELGNLILLDKLYLYNNQLTGEIPTEIGNLTSLGILQLHQNQLTGTIPTEIGNISGLSKFFLYDNQLEGDVPANFAYLYSLSQFTINENNFTGLPDLSGTNIFLLETSYNNLTFEDIEPNISINLFGYTDQAKVGETQTHLLSEGDNLDISVEVGGSVNTYQWYKDDSPISGATNDTYSITNYNSSEDAGFYVCQINNTIITDLTLTSEDITVGDITAIENMNEISINTYPNPVTDILFINTNKAQISDIEIINTKGEVVYKKNNITSNNYEINVSGFDSGIYFIKISNGKDIVRKKIIFL